jgi:hypothetical protein
MDPLAALLSERPPQLMSATELRSYIAQLEDAARACCAELESRTTRLDVLPDENPQEIVIFGHSCATRSKSAGRRGLQQREQGAARADAAGW